MTRAIRRSASPPAATLAPLAVTAFCVVSGLALAYDERAGLAVFVAALLVVAVAVRRELLWWDVFLLVLGGAWILDYGFANIGINIGVPVPVAELVLIGLLTVAMLRRSHMPPASAPFVLAALFLGLSTVRLIADYPQWGHAALRDFTLPIELGYLVVGYYALAAYGLMKWVRSLRWLFVAALGYLAFYPWRDGVAEAGPVVGLQHPVSLLGNYWAAGLVASTGFFFFALVRPFGRMSYWVAAGFLPAMFLVQARSLYIAVPAAALMVLSARGDPGRRMRRGLFKATVVACITAGLVLSYAPEGRLGKVTPGFVSGHVATLWGRDGPGSGSLEHRKEWLNDVMRKVDAAPAGILIGVGLGTDLAGGFEGASGTLVRKPHNDYLEIYARLGIVGFAIFIGMLVAALVRITRSIRRVGEKESDFLWWVLATAAIYLLVAATQPVLAYAYGTIPLFVLLGAGLAIADAARKVPPSRSAALRW